MDEIVKFQFMDMDTVVAEVTYDPAAKKGTCVQYRNKPGDLATLNPNPTWEDVQEFLETRCFERGRYDLPSLLHMLDLDSYDPYEITKRTLGRLRDDYRWIRYEGDNSTFEDIRLKG